MTTASEVRARLAAARGDTREITRRYRRFREELKGRRERVAADCKAKRAALRLRQKTERSALLERLKRAHQEQRDELRAICRAARVALRAEGSTALEQKRELAAINKAEKEKLQALAEGFKSVKRKLQGKRLAERRAELYERNLGALGLDEASDTPAMRRAYALALKMGIGKRARVGPDEVLRTYLEENPDAAADLQLQAFDDAQAAADRAAEAKGKAFDKLEALEKSVASKAPQIARLVEERAREVDQLDLDRADRALEGLDEFAADVRRQARQWETMNKCLGELAKRMDGPHIGPGILSAYRRIVNAMTSDPRAEPRDVCRAVNELDQEIGRAEAELEKARDTTGDDAERIIDLVVSIGKPLGGWAPEGKVQRASGLDEFVFEATVEPLIGSRLARKTQGIHSYLGPYITPRATVQKRRASKLGAEMNMIAHELGKGAQRVARLIETGMVDDKDAKRMLDEIEKVDHHSMPKRVLDVLQKNAGPEGTLPVSDLRELSKLPLGPADNFAASLLKLHRDKKIAPVPPWLDRVALTEKTKAKAKTVKVTDDELRVLHIVRLSANHPVPVHEIKRVLGRGFTEAKARSLANSLVRKGLLNGATPNHYGMTTAGRERSVEADQPDSPESRRMRARLLKLFNEWQGTTNPVMLRHVASLERSQSLGFYGLDNAIRNFELQVETMNPVEYGPQPGIPRAAVEFDQLLSERDRRKLVQPPTAIARFKGRGGTVELVELMADDKRDGYREVSRSVVHKVPSKSVLMKRGNQAARKLKPGQAWQLAYEFRTPQQYGGRVRQFSIVRASK